MNVGLYKAAIIFTLLYYCSFLLGLAYFFQSIPEFENMCPDPNIALIIILIVVGVLLLLFALFCTFYIMIYTAKTVKAVELQQKVTFNEYGVDFVLIWFYFVGVWLLQPRLNKMIEKIENNELTENN